MVNVSTQFWIGLACTLNGPEEVWISNDQFRSDLTMQSYNRIPQLDLVFKWWIFVRLYNGLLQFNTLQPYTRTRWYSNGGLLFDFGMVCMQVRISGGPLFNLVRISDEKFRKSLDLN